MNSNDGQQEPLLSANALSGLSLGISVSESPDLPQLGLLEIHFRLALGELARTVLVSGGSLDYGGHLDGEGYTAFLTHELHRFGRRDRPFHSILAWPEHRKLTIGKLRAQTEELGLYGDIIGLDPSGSSIDIYQGRSEAAIPETDATVIKKSLTSLRQFLANRSRGRIFLGGKRDGFQGDLPGVVEEAIYALRAAQPIYLAGGFGGATADIAALMGTCKESWIPRYENGPDVDPRWTNGVEMLREVIREVGDTSLQNGLTVEENMKLAVSHRPSEIAALVSLGMGRRFAKEKK